MKTKIFKYDINEYMNDLGLEISADTGGYIKSDHQITSMTRNESGQIELVSLDQAPIKIESGEIFLKALFQTADTFNCYMFQ